jgi:hypothetical protein
MISVVIGLTCSLFFFFLWYWSLNSESHTCYCMSPLHQLTCWLLLAECYLKIPLLYMVLGWVLVTHAYNPSCSGGKDQEDHGSKSQSGHNSSQDPILKKFFTKKGWWSGSRCRPWVQTPVPKQRNVIGTFWQFWFSDIKCNILGRFLCFLNNFLNHLKDIYVKLYILEFFVNSFISSLVLQ